MKTLVLAAAAALGLAGTVSAEDFTDTATTLTFTKDVYEVSITGSVNNDYVVSDDVVITGSADVLEHTVGFWDANVEMAVGYANSTDLIGVSAAYQLSATSGAFTSTVDMGVSYLALADALDTGETYVSPTLGLSYAATDTLDVFGEVSYDWKVSGDTEALGGTMEVGAIVALSDTVDFGGSVVRTFDSAETETNQAAVEVTFNF